VVAEVDKEQASVIALAMNPAGELDALADVRRAKDGARVRTITL
jgi:hypothetical protein